jgi:hypothetical protein
MHIIKCVRLGKNRIKSAITYSATNWNRIKQHRTELNKTEKKLE